jgi:enoyl-CoA hydratase/carnithine racemase
MVSDAFASKALTLHWQGEVLHVRLASTSRLNLMTRALLEDLERLFRNVPEPARAIVITGAPRQGFMVGGDLRELEHMTPAGAEELGRFGMHVFDRVRMAPLPVVAALNGDALGAGFLLALACDLRLAAPTARLGYPEVRVGLMPGTGGTDLLVRMAGLAVARSLCLTGEPLSAERALALGLVDAVVPEEGLLDAAQDAAARMAALSPVAVRGIKAALEAAAFRAPAEAREREIEAFRRCFETEEFRARIAAFRAERR